MSKSECEAVALYQKLNCVYYLYKHTYEWDITNSRIVKVTRPWDVRIHRYRIPPLVSLIAILASTYVLLHNHYFPSQSEVSYVAEILLYMVIAGCFLHILVYKILLVDYADDVFTGINRLVYFNRSIKKGLPAEYKRSKYAKVRYGNVLKFAIYMLIILSATFIPFAGLYLKADPTVHIINHVFKALPIFPYILKSIFGPLFPLAILLFRYAIMVPPVYEICRSLILLGMVIILSIAQFQDAFDFQHQFFQQLMMMNSERQVSLQHIIKYRETFIIRDTYGICLSFGPFLGLTGVMVSVIYVNYCVIKMYDSLPALLLCMLVYLVSAAMFVLTSALNEGVAVEHSSTALLKMFRKGTAVGLKTTQLRYVTKVMKSLRVFSIPAGVPGFNLFTFDNDTRRHVLRSIMDYTIDSLLTF